ncbi:MAG: SAM-dependent methyltransferase [Acidimicrobiales bacterium]
MAMDRARMWDERYSGDEYQFGTRPARFLTAHAGELPTGGSALAVADGEGRNSVFLAESGLAVTAMDISPVGVDKARSLARARGVTVDLRVADILQWGWEPDAYDVVAAVFIQFLAPDQRAVVFEGMQRTLRPGGLLLLHGYRPEQIGFGTGGPPIPENLYTEAMLRSAFGGLRIEHLASYTAELEEGSGHVGPSALIDLIARKPAADRPAAS